MENNNSKSFIIFTGTFILCVFTIIITINLLPKNNESNSYYVKVDEEMSAKIETINIKNNKLTITTSGDAVEYCVKSTKTIPDEKNLCWKKIENNIASISIFKYKKYYIWIKDTNSKISSPISINTKIKESEEIKNGNYTK